MEILDPFVRYAARQKSQSVNRVSRCYDCRLFVIRQGQGSMRIGGEKHALIPGSAVFLPAGTEYQFLFSAAEPADLFVFNFDLTQEHSEYVNSLGTPSAAAFSPALLLPVNGFPCFSLPLIRRHCLLQDECAVMTKAFLEKEDFYRERVGALMKYCLYELLRTHDENPLVLQIREYVEENYSRSDLSDLEIARAIGYHPYYLSRVFKEHTGKTIRQHLIEVRLHHAVASLLESTLDIQAIAEQCGFSSAAYFIRRFNLAYNVSPAHYRRQFRE